MENIKHCYIAIGLLYLSNQEKNSKACGSSLRKWKSFAVAEVQKITANLRLRTTYCYFAEFAVAEQSLNLRCPALAKANGFQYYWTANGNVYVKKKEENIDSKAILIRNELDLGQISQD